MQTAQLIMQHMQNEAGVLKSVCWQIAVQSVQYRTRRTTQRHPPCFSAFICVLAFFISTFGKSSRISSRLTASHWRASCSNGRIEQRMKGSWTELVVFCLTLSQLLVEMPERAVQRQSAMVVCCCPAWQNTILDVSKAKKPCNSSSDTSGSLSKL